MGDPSSRSGSRRNSTWRRSWLSLAACASADPEIFFSADTATKNRAKLVCADCPVRQECLKHAITKPERFGIWGGLDEAERRVVARRLRDRRAAAARKARRKSA